MKKIKTILLIDDNDDDNFLHTYVIKKIAPEIEVHSVLTGELAIEYLQKCRDDLQHFPDIILLDINMPGMNGFEFLEEAKNLGLLNIEIQIIVVMLTSSLNPEDAEMAKVKYKSQISLYRNKPLTEEMLTELFQLNGNK